MIIIEQYENNANLERRYSDKSVYMLQVETGVEYAEAVDTVPCRYTYVETDKPVEGEDITGDELLEIMEEIV